LPLPTGIATELEKSPNIDGLLQDLSAEEKSQLQLTYPWVKSAASAELPEGLQSSEGIVAGILARNALTRGAFKSAAGRRSLTAKGLSPVLSPSNLNKAINNPIDQMKIGNLTGTWLGDELTLLGRDDQGFLLLSDVVLSGENTKRAASSQRLKAIVLRAAKLAAEDLVFEANLASTWTRLRHRIEDYLTELWQLGAFDGQTSQDAFVVRCGPSTMNQNDIDAGRMIAEITYQGVWPLETITVALELSVAQPASRRAA
jgi:uncharacterized protein